MKNTQNDMVFMLEFQADEINLIVNALRELPHRVSDDILKNIVTQVQKQTASMSQQQS